MMEIRVKQGKSQKILVCGAGENLLACLRRHRAAPPAPCGGKGNCGKCRVSLDGIGSVLACRTTLTPELWQQTGIPLDQPLELTLPQPAQAQIASGGLLPEIACAPGLYRGSASVPKANLDASQPFDERLEEATGMHLPWPVLSQVPPAVLQDGGQLTFYFVAKTSSQPASILRLVEPVSPDPLGIAVDIGTSTLAAWLYDLGSGRLLATAAALNPQQTFGADVISRIEYAARSPESLQQLRRVLLDALAGMSADLLTQASAAGGAAYLPEHVARYVFAGNTTMLHILAGIPTAPIAQAPYAAASLRAFQTDAGAIGLSAAAGTLCQFLPAVASYVGADITAGILACQIMSRETAVQKDAQPGEQASRRPEMLIDIGTNGEIVLSGPQGAVACATAAGPAFEGANISCGIGCVEGAIDRLTLRDGRAEWHVIGSGGKTPLKARGLCGSGLLAAIAILLELGYIDATGRIGSGPAAPSAGLPFEIVSQGSQAAVQIVPACFCAAHEPLILTQKDIRELQNAKAAIQAGIHRLLECAGLAPQDVGRVFLAGGFGSWMDAGHAIRIGILPAAWRGKTLAAGNTSGMGACMCLVDAGQLAEAERIASQIRYIELSSDRAFAEYYIDAMIFPDDEQEAGQSHDESCS